MDNSEQPVVVTQSDRDAAAQRLTPLSDNDPIANTAARIKRGDFDDHSWVQAFARHRLSHRDIPPGHVIVPVEPSEAMVRAGARRRQNSAQSTARDVWSAMINAIPKQGEV